MNDPSSIRAEVSEMQARAEVCNTIVGGTLAMRDAGTKYLPIEPLETKEAYVSRRDKTILFPAYQDSLDAMVGKPLGEPITCENVPPVVEVALENVDLAGRDLDTFAREWFRQSLIDGIGWVLVDYPRVPQGASLADERALKARPYLVHIPLSKVCGWKTEITGGYHKLTQFRWREAIEEPDGDFDIKITERIKVWEPGFVSVYVKNGGAYELDVELSGPVSLPEVPIVCFMPGRTGYFTAVPPLEDLAWLNVQHWQSSSDQRHVLHVARVPLLAADKDVRDDQKEPLQLLPNGLLVGLENLRYVEHTGAAINAGRQDLVDLKEDMRMLAGKVLTKQRTAVEAEHETKDGGSKLRQWTWHFQDCIEEVSRLMAKWIGAQTGGSFTIATDWDDLADPGLFTTILQAYQTGAISIDTWLHNAQRYGVLPPGRTIEQEKDLIDTQGPVAFGNEADSGNKRQ